MSRGRNDICYCGSGLKFKKCCIDKEIPVQTLQGSSESFGSGREDMMGKIKRIAEHKNFDSVEDLQQCFVGKSVDDFDEDLEDFEKDPTYQAQQLVYDAWEFLNKKDRVNCAKKALKLWPDCADAYSILANDFAKTLDKKIEYYKFAVQVGKRAIGDKIFREEHEHFWGILETRPFMRAKLGLATALWESGEHKLAISHLWDLLEYNPGDNQGIRYILIGWLFVSRDLDGVERLLKLNEDEGSASFGYSRLLYALVKNASLTNVSALLKLALKKNPFIPDYVFGKSKVTSEQAGGYSPGSSEEAIMYSVDGSGIQVWECYPKALLWLKENVALSSLH